MNYEKHEHILKKLLGCKEVYLMQLSIYTRSKCVL
jgi:hypothetical protein